MTLAAAGATFGVLASDSAAPPQLSKGQAQHWYAATLKLLDPLSGSLVEALQSANSWQSGQISAGAAQAAFQSELLTLRPTLHSLSVQHSVGPERLALTSYEGAIELYIQAFEVNEAATTLPGGPLVTQLQMSFERIRELGDHLFDDGTTELNPSLGSQASSPDQTAALAVPDWAAIKLSAGPPLDAGAGGHSSAGASTTRLSLTSWLQTVGRLPIPSAADVLRAVSSGLAASARAEADRLETVSLRLHAVSGAVLDQLVAVQFRSALLIETEAVLAAEAGDLSSQVPNVKSSLLAVAKQLHQIARGSWVPSALRRLPPIAAH